MVVPITFRGTGERAVASYNYENLAEGTGVVTYYLSTTNAGSFLNSNALISTDIEFDHLISNAAPATLQATYNFDLPAFNLPKNLRGTGALEIATGLNSNDGVGRNGYITATLYKYSNAVETSIVTFNTFNGGATDYRMSKAYSFVIPTTHFKKGDILRLKLEVYGNVRTATGNTHFFFGCDPLNRDGTWLIPSTDIDVSTKSRLFIPYNIDL